MPILRRMGETGHWRDIDRERKGCAQQAGVDRDLSVSRCLGRGSNLVTGRVAVRLTLARLARSGSARNQPWLPTSPGETSVVRASDEWLQTGDLGRLDEDGYLYVVGRIKNIIICGGFNITPEEVEAALEKDRRVGEAVVVSWPDDKLGEVPVAVVETAASADDILSAVSAHLAAYKRPRRLFQVDR